MDVAVSTSLTFNNINTALIGQGGGSFFANNPTTYGSAFLLAKGPQITVTNSTFDEAGYSNALSLWGASGFETGVTITGNTFTRSANRAICTAGETLSRVRGRVQGNTFEQGAYLDLQNLNLPAALPVSPTNALGITGGNTFTLLQGGFGIVVRDGQTPVNLAHLIISGNFFDGGLAVVNAISANNSVLSFGSNPATTLRSTPSMVGPKPTPSCSPSLVRPTRLPNKPVPGDRMIRSGSMMPPSPASPLIRRSPFFSSHSPLAISARPSTPASASSTTAMPSGTTPMAWPAAR
jgi:hypothetical protein